MNEPIKDITPPEGLLQEPQRGGQFAVAGFRNSLFVAELVHDEALARDRCRVLGYDFERARWDTLSSLEAHELVGEPPCAAPSVRFLAVRAPAAAEETLLLRFASPLGVRLLSLGANGRFEPCATAGGFSESIFGFAGLAELDGQLLGLRQDKDALGRIACCQLASGIWQPADLPDLPAGGRRAASLITAFAGALYVATIDGERGFELWRSEGAAKTSDWKLVFERGAWRYGHNREAFAMVHHGGGLYLITGTGEAARAPESKFLDYRGFEIIRVSADGTWDLMVGVPRFSPSGLAVPLSGLGAGMHPSLRLEYRTSLSFGGRLLLGLQGINGFQFWASADGEVWAPLPHPELAAIHQVDDCRAISLDGCLALVLETTDALGNQATRIWAGHPSTSETGG